MMNNPLISELDAMLKRLDIIADNTSDKNTEMLAKDCIAGLGQMTQQVKTILNNEIEDEKSK